MKAVKPAQSAIDVGGYLGHVTREMHEQQRVNELVLAIGELFLNASEEDRATHGLSLFSGLAAVMERQIDHFQIEAIDRARYLSEQIGKDGAA